MSLFPQPPTRIGVEMQETQTRLAHLKRVGDGWKLLALKTIPSQEAVNAVDSATVASALPSKETWSRTLELRIKKNKDLRTALDFHIEPLLPYALDQALVQTERVGQTDKTSTLSVFAIRHHHLARHIKALAARGLDPEKVTCVPHALAKLSTLFPPSPHPFFLIHEGEQEVTCLLIEQGHLLAARSFDTRLSIGTEVHKTLLSFSTLHKTEEFPSLLLLGKSNEAITKATGKPVFAPVTPQLSLSQEELHHYGIAIGIALAAEEINFRQKAAAYPHAWRRLKKPLMLSLSLFLLAIGLLGSVGYLSLQREKRAIALAYHKLQKEHNRAALPKTPQAYRTALQKMALAANQAPSLFPLQPITPKVGEILAWLSQQRDISLSSFHYTMVNKPDSAHPKAPYKVKVDLSFVAESAEAAARFHDLLSTPNPLLDPKQKIEWSGHDPSYRAVFYLQDKTEYVSCNAS